MPLLQLLVLQQAPRKMETALQNGTRRQDAQECGQRSNSCKGS